VTIDTVEKLQVAHRSGRQPATPLLYIRGHWDLKAQSLFPEFLVKYRQTQ